MARSSHQDAMQGNRTEQLRCYLNASANANAYARIRSRRNNARQLQEQLEDNRNTFHHNKTEPDQDECEWIEINEEETIDPIDSIIEARKAQHQELAKQHNYSNMIETLHSVYMRLKFKTKNWAGLDASNDFRNCNCLPSKKIARLVDLVDISGQCRTLVKFCSCTKDTVTLLQLGYMAGSPMKPQTAFSMPLMIFHNHLWNHCHVGTMPFTMALRDYLKPRSQRLYAKDQSHPRDLRRPFTAAVDIFRRLEDMTDNLNFRYLQLTKQQILANVTCPACFGPQPPKINVFPQSTRDQLIICLDGNFQHRHHSKASRDHGRLHIPRVFLDPIEVEAAKKEIRWQEQLNNTPAQRDRCTESHKAADDKRNESTWKGCDNIGLMGCCCRHNAAVYFANIHKSREQRSLPMALINWLLEDLEPSRPVSILYDIGCSLDKFINAQALLSAHRLHIKFGTSIFHAYVHNWLCQLKYNPRFNTGWGLLDGEGLERMWSYLAPLVSPLRYATCSHCLGAIAHRLKFHNQRGIKQLRNSTTPLDVGWQKQRSFQSAHTQEEDKREKKLVKLYKEEAVLNHLRSRLQGPELFLATEEDLQELLDRITEKNKQLKRDAESLNRVNQSIDFVKQFPNQTIADFSGTLTYEIFSAMNLDNPFWNNRLYYHCKAPWAIDSNVCAGINCVLLLSRIQEEFQLIAQELSHAVGWAISYHQLLKSNIDYLQTLHSNVDSIQMVGMNRKNKIKCIARELHMRLFSHQTLVQDWSDDVRWLWGVCQPKENKQLINAWTELMDQVRSVRRGWGLEEDSGDLIDEDVEEAALNVDEDDGEDAEDDWVDEIGYTPANEEQRNNINNETEREVTDNLAAR
ncbi:hypothetical protein PCANC_09273 [Puccinia coronata f. sp. avenae]|uniref:CxC1-like cysteine cluster associated with KDZ transposases domain-containing protein n=1 Tax=Puccinia coronata f. sp. avenae TaxID=200324 RepID=A0A2N5T333_9BASI|nr:hypothetical protein PCANC_09273 [Puccinia coronata f. sp. avenae]